MINVVRKSLIIANLLLMLAISLAVWVAYADAFNPSVSGGTSFGNVAIGTSATKNLTIRYDGGGSIQYRAVNSAYFTCINASCSGTISSGQSRSMTIRFAPTEDRYYDNFIRFEYYGNGGWNPAPNSDVRLNGTGKIAPSVSPASSLDFDIAIFGGTPVTRNITVSNNTGSTLTGVYLNVRGTAFSCIAGGFCNSSNKVDIGPGSSRTATIRFTPGDYGYDSNTLTVYSDNALDTSIDVIMSGYGVCPGDCLIVESAGEDLLDPLVATQATIYNYSYDKGSIAGGSWFTQDQGLDPEIDFNCFRAPCGQTIPWMTPFGIDIGGYPIPTIYCPYRGYPHTSKMDVFVGFTKTDDFDVVWHCSTGSGSGTVIGACGSAHTNGTTASQPTGSAACSVGTANWTLATSDSTASDGTYNWRCDATDGNSTMCASTLVVTPIPPNISVTPVSSAGSPYSFGNVPINTSASRQFVVENTGGGTLTGTAQQTGTDYTCASGCNYILTAGETQIVTIEFSPTSAVTYDGTINYTGDPDGNLVSYLTGAGVNSGTLYPDLVSRNPNPDPATAPPLLIGSSFDFTAYVVNEGWADAGASMDLFMYSVDGGANVLISTPTQSPILQGASSPSSFSGVAVPSGSTLTILHCADFHLFPPPNPGPVDEGPNEGNNCSNYNYNLTSGTANITANPLGTCEIAQGDSSCATDISWTSQNTTGPWSVTQESVVIGTSENSVTPVTRTINRGDKDTFAFLSADGITDSVSVEAVCSPSFPYWDGDSCEETPAPDLVPSTLTCNNCTSEGGVLVGGNIEIQARVINMGNMNAGSFTNEVIVRDASDSSVIGSDTDYFVSLNGNNGIGFGDFEIDISGSTIGDSLEFYHCVDVPVATNGTVVERTEGAADNCATSVLVVPVVGADPGVFIDAQPDKFVRDGDEVEVSWGITYNPSAPLDCNIYGPQLTDNFDQLGITGAFSDDHTVTLQNTSTFKISCVYPGDPSNPFEDDIIVEVIPGQQEI